MSRMESYYAIVQCIDAQNFSRSYRSIYRVECKPHSQIWSKPVNNTHDYLFKELKLEKYLNLPN